MRAKAIGALLGAVATAALLLPGAAGAKPAATTPAARGSRPETVESFQVKGTNGFTVEVTLHNRRRLNIAATALTRGKGGRSAVYDLPARQGPGSDAIATKIGNLGRIDVRFVPGSVKEAPPAVPGCHGGKVVAERGRFVGVIDFHGEHGYTQVRTDHAAGTITRTPSLTCAPPPPAPKPDKAIEREEAEAEAEEGGDEVMLSAAAGHGRIHFDASRLATESTSGKKVTAVTFVAVAGRHRGPIQEVSFAIATLLHGSRFLSPEPLHPTTGAVIHPPSPFSGSATFSREGAAPSWTGDLAVELPGFGLVPLAGKGTHASMCEAPACRP